MKTEANPTNLTGLRSSMDADRERERDIKIDRERREGNRD